eukprot:4896791-Amphidinium_carterae.1
MVSSAQNHWLIHTLRKKTAITAHIMSAWPEKKTTMYPDRVVLNAIPSTVNASPVSWRIQYCCHGQLDEVSSRRPVIQDILPGAAMGRGPDLEVQPSGKTKAFPFCAGLPGILQKGCSFEVYPHSCVSAAQQST